MHCSRVFRSSAPSDLLPSSPGGCRSGTAQGERGSTRSMEWGVGPGGEVSHRGCCPAEIWPAGHILEGTLAGPVRFQGRVARCVIQNWSHVLSAPRRAWNLHGNNGARCMDSRSCPGSRGELRRLLTQRALESPELGAARRPATLGRGRQLPLPDQARDIAAELAGWKSGELPGQVSEQFAS